MDTTNIILVAILVIFAAVNTFFTVRGKSKVQLEDGIREQSLMFFLYAEKQGWINEDKMKWCVTQMYNKFPEAIKKFIDVTTLEKWMQTLYDDFKDVIKGKGISPEILPNDKLLKFSENDVMKISAANKAVKFIR